MAEEAKQPNAEGTPAPEGGAAAAVTPEEEAAQAKAKKKKLLLIGAGSLVLVGIIVIVLVMFVFGGKKEDSHTEAGATGEHATAANPIFDIPQMNVNLMADDAQSHFLRATFALELTKPEDSAAAGGLLAKLQDDWQVFLRQMRFEDFRGTAAIDRVKEGLLLRARQTLAPVVVNDVLIREILVQ